MSVTDLSVHKPAAITMVILLLLGLGIFGYINMGADLLPAMDIPVIAVITTYPGAGAEAVEKDVVKPVEDALSGISGIDTMNSSVQEGYGQTVIQFTMETDMNTALMDVQKAMDTVGAELPSNAEKPVIYKFDPGAISILTLSLSGSGSYEELYNEADKIKTKIEKLPGIGQVSIRGGKEKNLIISLDKTALDYYGINLNVLLGKLKSENMTMSAGIIKQDKDNVSVKVVGEYENMDEVKNLLIPINGGGNIRLSEVADIRLDYLEDQNYIRLNRKNTIGVEIQKRSDANVVKAADAVKAEIPAITESLPSGMKLVVASDNSIFITSSLKGVRDNIAEGIITTALVLYLFLRSWRSSIIILVAIPTSLISTFFIMYVSGFTLNMMSLMALSLCIGILVDDSIVVLENIERHLHMGKSTVEAAIEGRKEIAMAAIAITLCDVVVFAPIAFVSGMTGAIFRQFGLTVVFAALFSLFVSFTITPMLASRVLKRNVKNVGEAASELKKLSKFTVLFTKATEIYKKFLIWSLHHRIKIVAVTVVALILSILLVPMHFIEIEFTPKVDSGTFTIALKLSPGSNLRQTDMKVKYIEQYLESIHDIKDYYTTVGSDRDTASANITVNLRDKKDRAKSQTQIAEEVRTWGKQLAGVEFTVGESSMGEGGSSSAITVDIVGSDINVLRDIAGKVEGIVKSVPGTIDVSNTSKIKGNELLIRIDRLAASNYGVSVSNIAAALHTAIQGSNAGVYRENGEEYDITVKFNNAQVKSAEEIGSIRIANDQNQSVFLNQVASLSNSDTQQSISRKDRQNTVQITANVQGRSVAQITREIAPKLDGLSKPAGYEVKFGGAQADTNTAFVALLKAFLVSIVLLYMILVVLYESFLTPFLRMLSLPVAIIGALCFLALTRNSLNIMSMIGIIMLDGLASKNGTLLIDYTNTLMKRGLPLREALLEAGVTRLRPILMTSATMIVGMLPAALAIGEGAEYKSGMAMVIIGGMIVSTILTPVLIPVVYTLIDDMRNFFSRRKKKNFVTNEVLSDEN